MRSTLLRQHARFTLIFIAVLTALGLAVEPFDSAEAAISTGNVVATPTVGQPGVPTLISGSGFRPRVVGTLKVGSYSTAIKTSSTGTFRAPVPIPNTATDQLLITVNIKGATAKSTYTIDPRPVIGVANPGGLSVTELQETTQAIGKQPKIVMFYESFITQDFPSQQATTISDAGAIPMLSWEPWNPTGGITQPEFQLSAIASGKYDAYIKRWASEISNWQHPIFLRFAHEMNGSWYPWSASQNNNTASDYIATWRHIHDLFGGAKNVVWVWSPNVEYPGSTPLSALYPGDNYVDWIGIDGYNWGSLYPDRSWQEFEQIFDSTLAAVSRVAPTKPVVTAETSSTEIGGNKPQWITKMFASLYSRTNIRGFVWFNINKETDWRINSSLTSQQAFAAGALDPKFR